MRRLSKTIRLFSAPADRSKRCPCLLYIKWRGMRSRCNNPNSKSYPWYGGKGIGVCPEWNDYLVFRQWAISNGFQKGLSLDRIDSSGDYKPSNCQWITHSENCAKANRESKFGVNSKHAKLNDGKVRLIRQSTATCRELAEQFGVDCSVISRVRQRKVWKHVT